MKVLVDQKASQNPAHQDSKIGQGGIREIEFIAQMFQLSFDGRDTDLRIRSTLGALEYFGEQEILSKQNVTDLVSAYLFPRKVENGLQIRDDQQTHILLTEKFEQIQYAIFNGRRFVG